MFNIDEFYKEAHSGNKVDTTGILEYIGSFGKVVIWGGSFLGKAVGKYLIEKGISLYTYWDIRHKELKEVNGIQVVEPFTTDREGTLIIFCIGNNVILKMLMKELSQKGYENVIRGDYLYMGTVCPFDCSTGITATRCVGTMECRQVYCHRLGNIVKSKVKNEDPIHLTSITLIINSRCSLKCKYCTSYMNEYPMEKRKDIPLERICDDIDKFFDAVDTVGTITVMGGEPFMHPDLSAIIEKLCEKDNFGLISIATSGTWPIKNEQLKGLADKRVNVSFSNYTESVNEKQKELFYQNIEKVKAFGICHTVGLFSPEWVIPSTLYDLNLTEQEKIEKKNQCIHWHQIKDGKVHPCDFATALYSLDIADFEDDYVDLTEEMSKEERKEKLRNYIDKPYYESCGYHSFVRGMTAKAAEQGYYDFKIRED